MKKIELSDIIDIAEYERKRSEYRPEIMQEKNKRRIYVGPKVTYLFETYDTMLYQVQEMMRAERIVDEEGILGELNAYNELIPEKNQLSASLLIEITDIEERKEFLSKIVDLPKHTYLKIDGSKVFAEFDPRQGSEDKLSSVQYIKYNFNDKQVSRFSTSDSKIILGFDHPVYSFQYELTSDQKKILFKDMQ
jgi:hypothetical protein